LFDYKKVYGCDCANSKDICRLGGTKAVIVMFKNDLFVRLLSRAADFGVSLNGQVLL